MRVYGTHVIRLIHHYASECIISQLRASILAAIYHGQVEITRVFERMTKKNPKSSAPRISTFQSIHLETVWCKKLTIKLELNTVLFKTWGTAAPKSCSLFNSSFYTSSSIVMCSERQNVYMTSTWCLLWTSPISHFSTSHLALDRDRGVHPRQRPGNETAVHEGVERDKSGKAKHLFQRDKSGKSEAFTWEQKPR